MPTSVEPVKAIMSTSGWRPSACPAVSPKPGTTWSTPSGMPASEASSARRSADSGDCSAGFSTTLLPVASAGASFHEAIMQREVPGDNRPDDAERLAHDGDVGVVPGRRDLVVHLVDRLAVPRDAFRRERHVDVSGIADRLAHVDGLEQRQLFGVVRPSAPRSAGAPSCASSARDATRRPTRTPPARRRRRGRRPRSRTRRPWRRPRRRSGSRSRRSRRRPRPHSRRR